MHPLIRTLAAALVGLSPLAAQGSEFGPLLSVAQRTWPDKTHIGIVCNYAKGQDMVRELARNAAAGTLITVVDTPSAAYLGAARNALMDRHTDYLVVLPRDPVFFEGSYATMVLVNTLASHGVPSVGTRPISLRQGAVFAIGPETGGELMVTDRLIGTVSVILPNQHAGLRPFGPASGSALGATLDLVSASKR